MRFHYTFQKVVDLKGNEKTQAEWMLSTALGELQAQEKSLDELLIQRSSLLLSLQSAAEQKTPMAKIIEMQNYVQYLDTCIARKHADINRAHQEVQHKQDHLSTKVLDEKVWLKARDKAKTIFQQNMILREQNELDEMATVRFAMKSL
ncbi:MULTISPECIES: flagellar export protein FliJ [unclassified Paenibacillus]|uniref:flagellar export protein FliJ n=1 Tax=unclassified Paenibacillus TaxID=185978 RepID=UPI0024055F97|nr:MULTISPECIES: flagellar export protein FliJ [unclassified Paenibacillus]MDF9841383.1 flagellar FliJ protein [Paenibacillus sp. PastF-2]MDF9847974.1 flagellar FliJ protein [Paenibacillus sp. PastM-2]MDF9854542.1 flagellar FliJ protein [Paenibacillus sp. PastF-1]MDH6479849.1 flagellar FliJ protein [Paenibacillus sp. PastH-2]MDH6507249.1 flagellar FliJ protein [Paenibacillus sp. PastM-3]